MNKFNHLTMSTGHNVVQRRSMMPNMKQTMSMVIPHLRAALDCMPAPVPGFPEYRLRAWRTANGFEAHVESADGPERDIAVKLLFAPDKYTLEGMTPHLYRWSDELVGDQRGSSPFRDSILRLFEETPAPVCVVFYTTLMALEHHRAMGWLGDYERCLCWGFIEMAHGQVNAP